MQLSSQMGTRFCHFPPGSFHSLGACCYSWPGDPVVLLCQGVHPLLSPAAPVLTPLAVQAPPSTSSHLPTPLVPANCTDAWLQEHCSGLKWQQRSIISGPQLGSCEITIHDDQGDVDRQLTLDQDGTWQLVATKHKLPVTSAVAHLSHVFTCSEELASALREIGSLHRCTGNNGPALRL